MISSKSITVVTILLSLYDSVEKVERHSEQLGVVYDKVVDRVISIPQSDRYGYHIPWSSQQISLAVLESSAILLDRLTTVIRRGDKYHTCSKYKTLVEVWSGRNVKLETVIMDIAHYPSLEKAVQHCKRLDTGNRVRLFLDGNFDTPFYPALSTARKEISSGFFIPRY